VVRSQKLSRFNAKQPTESTADIAVAEAVMIIQEFYLKIANGSLSLISKILFPFAIPYSSLEYCGHNSLQSTLHTEIIVKGHSHALGPIDVESLPRNSSFA
jgi:hypothetical protein